MIVARLLMAEVAQKKTTPSNLTQRIVTAIIAIPPVLLLIALGDIPFALLVGVVAVLAVLEMFFILRRHPVIFLLSLVYILSPLIFLIILRQSSLGIVWMALIISITWVTDVMSYVGGRLYGKTPLAATISPNKTVEGAVVGYISGAVATVITLLVAGYFSGAALLLALFGPITGIAGDLFESLIKRRYHIKDSHLPGFNILPGHGGIMDRIDGLLFVCAFCYGFAVLIGLH